MPNTPETTEYIKGVDIYYNEHSKRKPIPFDKFVEDGIEICYIGVSEGDWVKPDGKLLYQMSKGAGLLTSAYHLITPWTDGENVYYDVEDEVQTFLEAIHFFDPDLPYCIDMEHDDAPVSPEQRVVWVHAFAARVWEETGMKPIIYTSQREVRKGLLPNEWDEDEAKMEDYQHGLGVYDLWVADYSGPIDLPYGWEDWQVHQDTSKYMTRFDHNFFKKDWVEKYKKKKSFLLDKDVYEKFIND